MNAIQPSFVRDSFNRQRHWVRLAHASQPLGFQDTAAPYLEADRPGRAMSGTLARQLQTDATHTLIAAIPCAGAEPVNIAALSAHVRSFARCGGHVAIFVNCAEPAHRLRARGLATTLRHRLAAHCPPGSHSIVDMAFDAPLPIGQIRAILCDAIIQRAFGLGAKDLVLVSNDADGLFTPQDYAQRLVKAFADPRRDIVTGPLYYGYAPWGESFLTDGFAESLPELMLGNRVLEARRKLRLTGLVDGGPFFTTEGPHTAFRAAAYCAAGGYDTQLAQAEDDELGLALFALRQSDGPPYPRAPFALYDPGFWLATDARRQVLAIARGQSITQTWAHFPIRTLAGHDISIETATALYRGNKDVLQHADIRAALAGTPRHIARMRNVFQAGITDLRPDMQAAQQYLSDCGIIPGRGPDQEQLSPDLRHALHQLNVDPFLPFKVSAHA